MNFLLRKGIVSEFLRLLRVSQGVINYSLKYPTLIPNKTIISSKVLEVIQINAGRGKWEISLPENNEFRTKNWTIKQIRTSHKEKE